MPYENRLLRPRILRRKIANEEQQCQAEQADAEIQFRSEQAKMIDLQDQLDNLDRVLASQSRTN